MQLWRKRGRNKRIWLDRVKDDIKEKVTMDACIVKHGPHAKLEQDEKEEE